MLSLKLLVNPGRGSVILTVCEMVGFEDSSKSYKATGDVKLCISAFETETAIEGKDLDCVIVLLPENIQAVCLYIICSYYKERECHMLRKRNRL